MRQLSRIERLAYMIGVYYSVTFAEFTVNDIWDDLDSYGMSMDGSAMPGVMKRLQADRWAKPTDRSIKSTRKSRHASRVTVWVPWSSMGADDG